MRFKNQAIVITVLFVVVVLLGAYAIGNKTNPKSMPPQTTPQSQVLPKGTQGGQLLQNKISKDNTNTQQNLQILKKQMAGSQKKAEGIKKGLEKLSQIDKANVLVVGNTAIVGCKLSKKAKNINAAKNMVTDRVKAMDKTVKNVIVSDSVDIMSRINKLSNDITNNRDINEINKEANEIMQKGKILVK